MEKTVLITGATGMIGKGILLECIKASQIKSIVLIGRSQVNIQNNKIKQIILGNFMNMETIQDQLKDIDACFHCMGVSSVGLSEEKFSEFTFDITKKIADVCYNINPKMTFNYVSGAGTDSSEKGRIMWARVKGKTENYIISKGFEKSYMFQPGFVIPEKGIKSRTKLYQSIYNIMEPFFPLLKKLNNITTTTKIGQAMINSIITPKIHEVRLVNKMINELAGQ